MSARLRLAAAPCATIAGLVCAIYLALDPPLAATADDLPPRPTRVPATASAWHAPNEKISIIVLQAPNLPPQTHTVVQWQDPTGRWHDVEGWQQPLGDAGTVRWSVYPRDFGTGPFRWALFDGAKRALLATSSSFRLPGNGGQVIQIVETLPP